MKQLTHADYLDKVHGGWVGKSIGGTIGARFEGNKHWLDISREDLFPDTIPPNDDLDLQVLWLKVLEEKGPYVTSDDLAAAWLEYCWYPFCEYGVFRRNWRLGIRPPVSGCYGNQLWETGMGCPIRSEIWGYINPGRPEEAARMARMDGELDHTEQSVGAEMLLAAMAADAFFEDDLRMLSERHLHYLPVGSHVEHGVRVALDAYDAGLSLRTARDRVIALAGVPEACDARINIPIVFLGLLYGEGDLEQSLQASLHCGYDVDCSMATVGALVGQVLGASRLPDDLRNPIGDDLVMGIAYERPEMTISALARDTARVGVLLQEGTKYAIQAAPELEPFPETARPRQSVFSVGYSSLPVLGPGESIEVGLEAEGLCSGNADLQVVPVQAADGWSIEQTGTYGNPRRFLFTAPERPCQWPLRNIFEARGEGLEDPYRFGIAGAGVWHVLGVHFHLEAPADVPDKPQREWHHHFASVDRDYVNESNLDVLKAYREFSDLIGKPARIYARENEIDLDALLGLKGSYCAYLARKVISPCAQDLHAVIGNTDSFRLYVNGDFVGERDEHIWWTPQNNSYLVPLKKGENTVVVKLVKYEGTDFRFTFAFRTPGGPKAASGQHFCDWSIDLADGLLDA